MQNEVFISMAEVITHSRAETVALGQRLAAALPDGALLAFTGGLGAGKTAFCEGLAKGLGCTDPVSSPTFAIVNYYRGPRPLAHFDLYRIQTENDLAAAGFYDYLDQGVIVAAEWSENMADLLEAERPIHIAIRRIDDTTRAITIEGIDL
jgi:tRNA threonylcarbamoyladenosine biosynthesis protein TsaE